MDTYKLKYAKFKFCKVPKHFELFENEKDGLVLQAITSNANQPNSMEKYVKNIVVFFLMIISERVQALSPCTFYSVLQEDKDDEDKISVLQEDNVEMDDDI
jgi:hypothetical protein